VPVSHTGLHTYPPVANDWADSGMNLRNFDVLPRSQASAGDIIAFQNKLGSGHTTIKAGPGLLIYAGPDKAMLGSYGWLRNEEGVHGTVRRFVPK